MKVLHVLTYDTGGAAKACVRLHKGLLEQGVNSKVLVLYKTQNHPHFVDFRNYLNPFQYWYTKLKNKIRNWRHMRTIKKYGVPGELISYPNSTWHIHKHPEYEAADLIHFHWVSGFLNWKEFFADNIKPLVWTFHDHEPYSGGWHYAYDLNLEVYQKLFNKQIEIKMKALGNNYVSVVCPSKHLQQCFQKNKNAQIFKNCQSSVIRNGLTRNEVAFIDQTKARQALNLPTDKQIVLFLSEHLNYSRKGLNFLLEAKALLNQPNLLFVLVGNPGNMEIPLGNDVLILPPTHSEKRLNLLYAAADVYVNPTMDDISSNTLMESQLAGCPVVAFDTGGLNELAGLTKGCVLTLKRSAKELASKILASIEQNHDRKLISQEAQAAFDIKPSVIRYIECYKELLPN